jgi:acetate kinase
VKILTINSGSSSVKFALHEVDSRETLLLRGTLERIGLRSGAFRVQSSDGSSLTDEQIDLADHEAAVKRMFAWLEDRQAGEGPDAVGHRVVHGGADHAQPQLITDELLGALRELTHLAPDHLPHEIKAIAATTHAYPALPQVACFDTAFHRHMPELAQAYPLPRQFTQAGLVRYGFHGLSYEYILQELRKEAGADAASGRLIIAHLGNGASMAAVKNGRSMDTTMGFTPAGGLVMSTRTGDLDPGVLIYLLDEQGMRPSTLNDLVNRHAGLQGVSGVSSDMRDLLQREPDDAQARLAVNLFCYQAAKHLGALATVLGGLDTLIFTAGIGENSPEIRGRICKDLGFLGIRLDPKRNAQNASIVSAPDSPVTVRVMHTDEDLMIARHTYSVLHDEEQPVD